MKKWMTLLLALTMIFSMTTVVGAAHDHDLREMADDDCHYLECTICHEWFVVINHSFTDGFCTECGYPDITDHEHELMSMANAACHYSECTVCYKLFNVGDHTFADGVCTVCGHSEFVPPSDEETIRGEGEHTHLLLSMANMVCHYEECQVCFELFNVGDHTFADGACTVCGHPEYKNPFVDVKDSAWYYNDVAEAVFRGLINGKSATEFAPEDKLTYAEAIKLAACMHQRYTEGQVTLQVGSPWYEPYVAYSREHGIITEDYTYTDYVTRAGYMEIFARALPDEAYYVINNIPDGSIADVSADTLYADAVYRLYRAGIVTGVDGEHNCNPSAGIMRCEVATIVNRMMNTSVRIRFDMGSDRIDHDYDIDDDLYIDDPSLDIVPLTIVRQPQGMEASRYGGKAELYAEVKYGIAPYTYEWYYKVRRDKVIIENGEYAKDACSEALVLSVEKDSPLLGVPIYCEITDAEGTKVTTNPVKVYGPFSMTIEDVYVEEAEEYEIVGRIADGVVRVGDRVSVEYNGKIITIGFVKDIQMFNKSLEEAVKGDRVGIVTSLITGVRPRIGGTVMKFSDLHVLDTSDIIN